MRIKGLPVVRSGELFRADIDEEGSSDTLGTMFVRFSPFNTWYEINSFWEGRFLERTLPGSFKNTINANKRSDGTFGLRSLFNHGMDLQVGDKILGVPNRFAEVKEDDYHGPELEVPLLDTSYNRDLAPALRANGYGSSFMFESIRESWVYEPEPSDYNPEGLPERSLQEVRTFEAGPVTWGASPTATSGMRSFGGTDALMERMATRSPERFDGLVHSYKAFRALRNTPDARFTPTPDADASRRQVEQDAVERDRTLRKARLLALRR